MNSLQLFLPCAAGVEDLLADEVHHLTGLAGDDLMVGRGGVLANASWRESLRLNLHSRLAQRVLVQLSHTPYRDEADLYRLAGEVDWRDSNAIMMMTIDNLPCELPRDASEDFGQELMNSVIPALLKENDPMIMGATETENGQLMPAFQYLQDYANKG